MTYKLLRRLIYLACALCLLIMPVTAYAVTQEHTSSESRATDQFQNNHKIVKVLAEEQGAPHSYYNDVFKGHISESDALHQAVNEFYDMNGNHMVWHDPQGNLLNIMPPLIKILKNLSYAHGLNHGYYDMRIVYNYVRARDRDRYLTYILMRFMKEIQSGRIDPKRYDKKIFVPEKSWDLARQVFAFLEATDKAAYLDNLAPSYRDYDVLKRGLAAYRASLHMLDDAPSVEGRALPVLYPGDRHEFLHWVRKRLHADPYIFYEHPSHMSSAELSVYNGELEPYIRMFQAHHGLKADGVIGPKTATALRVPLSERIMQIIMAMERWRWIGGQEAPRYVVVNIAGYHLKAMQDGRPVLAMPIIVGEVKHQTPVFSSVINDVRFHPDWTVPSSIAQRYLIDKIQADPDLIYTMGYQVQSRINGEIIPWHLIDIATLHNIDLGLYQFRQRPGRNNALGQVRFSVQNDYAIYLHGTPSAHLFNKEQRTFSSGCIRVAEPLALLKFIFAGRLDMNEARIKELYQIPEHQYRLRTKRVKIDDPVPVHLMYSTAWVDEHDQLRFADDVYRRDQRLQKQFASLE